ncbi:vWA domain-containing protein [Nocardiopsis sp. CC223A]|uniref:vWA domain-containing protein n=1 Tax=Nocardiopsis sp. CC223A TaxID=3044051 RepID=UPI00278C40A0|nr:vWA domain-containing protein [Nocardiopsis sp. CC223A]
MAHTPRATPTRRTALAVVCLPLLLLGVPAPAAALAPAPVPQAAAEDEDPTPLDIVILVDESGSLTDEDVAEEAKAASALAQSVLNPGSRVAVFGFGSNNGPGQIASREVCAPTFTDEEVGRQYLADCTDDLHRRDDTEGNDTDHALALDSALNVLGDPDSPAGSAKLVFLLTDGALDVGDSPGHGPPDRRNENAAALIDEHLAQARETGVQVWPLGFGDAIDRDQLDDFAAGGADSECSDLDVAAPTARVVEDSSDVLDTFQEALAAATCSALSDPDGDTLPGGDTVTLSVEVPVMATDGALMVVKNNPAITVEYTDPDGTTVDTSHNEHNGSPISLSGRNGPVEVLRMVDPNPGTWQVRLTSPAGTPEEPVTARIQWKGFINTHLGIETTGNANAVDLIVYIRTRRGPVTDPEALSTLTFTAQVTYPSGDTADITLRDDGTPPDDAEHDGQYSGTIEIPEGTDSFEVTSRVQGPGISDDVRTVPHTLDAGALDLSAAITIDDPPAEVWPGTLIEGTLTVANQGSDPRDVLLTLDAPEGLLASLEQDTTSFAPGNGETAFGIRVGEGSEPSSAPVAFTVGAENADGTRLTVSQPVQVQVRTPPGILERFVWLWSALTLALAAAGLLLVLALIRRREARDVRGLVVRLHRGGSVIGPHLRAPSRRASSFALTITDPDGSLPRLENATGRGPAAAYRVERRPDGVRLSPPRGPARTVRFAEPAAVTADLALSFVDERRPRGPRPDRRRPQRTDPPGTAPLGEERPPPRGGGIRLD